MKFMTVCLCLCLLFSIRSLNRKQFMHCIQTLCSVHYAQVKKIQMKVNEGGKEKGAEQNTIWRVHVFVNVFLFLFIFTSFPVFLLHMLFHFMCYIMLKQKKTNKQVITCAFMIFKVPHAYQSSFSVVTSTRWY